MDNPSPGAKTKDLGSGVGGREGTIHREASLPNTGFSFVDALENVLGMDINGDGYKGQGYGLVDGLEAVSRLRGQGRKDAECEWWPVASIWLSAPCRVQATLGRVSGERE